MRAKCETAKARRSQGVLDLEECQITTSVRKWYNHVSQVLISD